MVTTILRPNSTDANAWSGGSHLSVDDPGVEDPDNGDDVCLTASEVNADDNDLVDLGFPTIANIDEVTNIRVKSLASSVGGGQPEVDVNMGGWQGYQECTLPTNWTSNSFNGNWSQADLDGLQVRYRADVPVKLDSNNLDVVYVIVTYSVPAGYGHDYMGVPAANIGSVNGVPTANIASIKGV